MQFARLIVFGIIAFLGLSCSRVGAPASGTRSLDELALGKEDAKACAGTVVAEDFTDRVIYADGVDSGELKPALDQALTAVPLHVRQLFHAVGGQILVTPEAASLCDSPSAVGRSLSSCFKVEGTLGGKQDGVTIVLAADAATLASRTVRAYGYIVSQYFGRLYKKSDALELKLGLNSAFQASQTEVGNAFLEDLKLVAADGRAAELASRAFAEAFDSWYCRPTGPEEMHARFPKTYEAFGRVDASVQSELARALANFQKKKALRLQDSAPGEEKINGDLSQAAIADVTGATSSGADPLISGSSTPEKTFTDPAPTTGPAADEPAGGKPDFGPNDVVVTINADGTVSGAGTDNIANDGQLVVVDNRDKTPPASTAVPATDTPATDTPATDIPATDIPATYTPYTKPTDEPTATDAPPATDTATVPTDKPGDILTGGSQPNDADRGPPAIDQGPPTEVAVDSYDPYQTQPAYAEPFYDGGGQVFAIEGCE